MAFTRELRVRFGHCDPAGIVFYPRYFEMVNDTVEDWFAGRLEMPFGTMHGAEANGVPTARIEVRFTAPSRIGDRLLFTLAPERIGRSSLDLHIVAACGDETRLDLRATLVQVSLASGRSHPWPARVRERVEAEIEGKA